MNALRIGSLFSGVGGLDLAVEEHFDAETVWHCEFDPEPSKVLTARWPGVPNFGDVTKVPWWLVAPVDILCGGFPCQDVSVAGRQAGMVDGTRSGLWSHFRLAISILRPKVVVIENVRGLISAWGEPPHAAYLQAAADVEHWNRVLTIIDRRIAAHGRNRAYVARKKQERHRCARSLKSALARREREDRLVERALPRVLRELSELGFDAEWHGLLASDIGAPHGRFRVFILAYARGVRFDARWSAAPGEEAGGRASAVVGGRADAPVALLPTPSASNANDGEGADTWLARRERVQLTANNGNGMGMPLAIAVQLLPTPTASEANHGGPNRTYANGSPTLGGIGKLLPTPVTQPETGNGHARNLGKEVRLLPTPQVADMQGGHAARSGDRADELLLPGLAKAAAEGKLLPAQGILPREFDTWDEVPGRAMLPTPRASRGASGTETMYALGAERDDEGDRQGNVVGAVQWGEYEPAIRLWESLTRPAPAPTLPDGKNGAHRLAAVFPEWMMGYSAGWVTDILGRNPAIKACGNGVLPQQAVAALSVMWARVLEAVAV